MSVQGWLPLLTEDGWPILVSGDLANNSAVIRGLAIGAGTPFTWKAYPSGLGTPEIRVEDRHRPRRHGVTAGGDLLGAREVEFVIQVAGTAQEIEQHLTDLAEAFAPSDADEWLYLRLSGAPAEYALRGRPRGVAWNLSRRYTHGLGDAVAMFTATDPLKYGPSSTVTLSLPSDDDGGLLFDADDGAAAPFEFGSSGGDAVLVNPGNVPVHWQAAIAGPIVRPSIYHAGLGRRLAFNVAVPEHRALVLDSSAPLATLDGAAHQPTVDSAWWLLPPGSSTLRFRAESGSGSASVTFRPGYQ